MSAGGYALHSVCTIFPFFLSFSLSLSINIVAVVAYHVYTQCSSSCEIFVDSSAAKLDFPLLVIPNILELTF